MIEQILNTGSVWGVALLFIAVYLVGNIANTSTKMSEGYKFQKEVMSKFGIDTFKYPFTFKINKFLGIVATFWLPIYVWVISFFWAGLIVFFGQLFLVAFLSRLISSKGYFILWRLGPLSSSIGFILTISSLL